MEVVSKYLTISKEMNEFISYIINNSPNLTPLQTMQVFRAMLVSPEDKLVWKNLVHKLVTKNEPFKRGIYETSYGNSCYVSGPKAKKAWDLDSAEYIPISEVVKGSYKRKAESSDTPTAYNSSY